MDDKSGDSFRKMASGHFHDTGSSEIDVFHHDYVKNIGEIDEHNTDARVSGTREAFENAMSSTQIMASV